MSTAARPGRRQGRPPRRPGVGGGGDDLRRDRAPGRPGQPRVQAEHQRRLERDVDHVRPDRDPQRRPGVLLAGEVPVARERQVEERQADRGDPHVLGRGRAGRPPAAQQLHRVRGQRSPAPSPSPRPRPPRPRRRRRPPARPPGARRSRCSCATSVVVAVDRKIASHATTDSTLDRDRQRVKRRPAQMADDRRVGEVVERLGRDRPEGRYRQLRDPPVQVEHGPSIDLRISRGLLRESAETVDTIGRTPMITIEYRSVGAERGRRLHGCG